MKNIFLIFLTFFFISCYKQLEMGGFEKNKWTSYSTDCSMYRVNIAPKIIKNKEILLESTQNEIESILGNPQEHELYKRNQKNFYYRLTPPTDCGNFEIVQYLSIRFNGLGRANLVQVISREKE